MNDIVRGLSAEPGQRFPSESGRSQTSILPIRDIPTNVGVAPARAGGLSDLERDVRAVKRSNRRAQESADRGDYVDALGWLKVIEAIVGRLSSSVQVQQQAWGLALAAGEHGKAQTKDSYEARVAGASRAAPSNAR